MTAHEQSESPKLTASMSAQQKNRVLNDHLRNTRKGGIISISLGIPSVAQKAYWAEGEVAKRLNLSVQFLRKQRYLGQGIPYSRFSRAIRYRISDVLAYEKQCVQTFTGQNDQA